GVSTAMIGARRDQLFGVATSPSAYTASFGRRRRTQSSPSILHRRALRPSITRRGHSSACNSSACNGCSNGSPLSSSRHAHALVERLANFSRQRARRIRLLQHGQSPLLHFFEQRNVGAVSRG